MYTNTNNVQKRRPGRPPGAKNKRKRRSVKIVNSQSIMVSNQSVASKETLETIKYHLARIEAALQSL